MSQKGTGSCKHGRGTCSLHFNVQVQFLALEWEELADIFIFQPLYLSWLLGIAFLGFFSLEKGRGVVMIY